MRWRCKPFSTELRCSHCGIRLQKPVPECCPNCATPLIESNIDSELKEWGQIRKAGVIRFVFWRGGLLSGGLGIIWIAAHRSRAGSWRFELLLLIWGLFCGWVFALAYWRLAEEQFQRSIK